MAREITQRQMDAEVAEVEAAAMVADGCERLTINQIEERLAQIGYRLDRDRDCRGYSRIITGPRAGTSYPEITTGVNQADDGVSAFNVNARRDANFRALQQLRMDVFAVHRGAIFTF